jgi:arginyl-tRNA synthetase
MIKDQVEQDLRSAIGSLQTSQQWSDFEIPELAVEMTTITDECAYTTNVAMSLAPHLKKHALEVAADLKKEMPSTYADVDIVAHGTIKIVLSQAQLQQAVQDVMEQGNTYGSSKVGAGKSVLIECFSSVPSHPLNLADARAAYTADVMGRVHQELGYQVTKAVMLHDREDEIERLGESVARRYLQRMGINVPYDDHLIDADYVNELATHIELKDMTLENVQKIEWLKQHIADEATDMMRQRMDDVLKNEMHIRINEWGVESRVVNQIAADAMLNVLRERNQVYDRAGSVYARTAQLGDVRDRTIVDRDHEPTDQYAELVLYYDRVLARKHDRIILSLPWTRQERAWFARQIPKLFGHTGTVATIVCGPLNMMAEGKPLNMKNTSLEEIYIHDVIDTYGANIIRWFMVKNPTDVEADFDVQRINRSIGDELAEMKKERKMLRMAMAGVDEGSTAAENVDNAFELPVERRLLRLLLFFPELLENLTKRNQTGLLYEYLQELREAALECQKTCPLLKEGKVIVYRYLLLQGALLVMNRVLHLTAMKKQPKK